MARSFSEKNVSETPVNRTNDFKESTTQENKNRSVKLLDIDEAVQYFFKDVIQPYVIENSEKLFVPVLYGSPERWNMSRSFGFLKDINDKVMLPLIMYRRTSIAQSDKIVFPRIFGNELKMISKRKWNKSHAYNNFNLSNKTEIKSEYSLTSVPNYVTISYEVLIWTSFVEQMNGVIEKIMFANNSYWGDDDKYKFLVKFDSFDNSIDISTDAERVVKTTFNLELNGYLLPEDFNNKSTTDIAGTYKITMRDSKPGIKPDIIKKPTILEIYNGESTGTVDNYTAEISSDFVSITDDDKLIENDSTL